MDWIPDGNVRFLTIRRRDWIPDGNVSSLTIQAATRRGDLTPLGAAKQSG